MPDVAKRRPAPFSVRLRPETEARLKRDAARHGMTAGSYINWVIDNPGIAPPMQQGELEIPAKIIALLGQGRVSQNLSQIARAANLGVLPVSPELEAELSRIVAELSALFEEARLFLKNRRRRKCS